MRCSIRSAVLVAVALSASLLPQTRSVAAEPEGEWKLVWSDEFDKDGLPDAEKWMYEEGFIRNNELQYYMKERKENARVEDGMLVIEGRKETLPNPRHQAGSKDWKRSRENIEYTSASLTTDGLAEWTYGRFEVRAKLPTGRGTWPAIWMLGVNRGEVGWPSCGEIDIMENVGYAPDRIHANVHMKKYNHAIGTGKGDSIIADKPYEKFHVYAVEWTPEKMDFFLDDEKYFTFENEKSGVDAWPFDKPHYLILNFAIGGAWGGSQGMDDSILPQKYFIDYVRVYERVK